MSVQPPPDGWLVEVDHPDGVTVRPQLLDDPVFRPRLNDLPRVEIPVPRQRRWESAAWRDQPLRVWQDGDRLPIDTVVEIRQEEGEGRKRTVLVGEGGSALRERVEREFDNTEAHLAAQDLIQTAGLTADVDDPGTQQTEELFQDASTDPLDQFLLRQPTPTDPWFVDGTGDLSVYQTCFTQEGESGTSDANQAGRFSGGFAAVLSGLGDSASWSWEQDYQIPDGDFEIAVRVETTGTAGAVDWSLDGVTFRSGVQYNFGAIQWLTVDTDSVGVVGAGSHTLDITMTTSTGEALYIDVVAPRDGRFTYLDDNNNGGSGGYLDGPQLYPLAVDVPFNDTGTPKAVVGGRVDATLDDVSNGQALAISNDQGQSFVTASNTQTLDQQFPSGGASLRFRATLSRYGSRSDATPQTGFKSQTLQGFKLFADVEPTPILDARALDGQIVDLLQRIADYGNFIWEVRYDGGSQVVVFTQPGLREGDADPDIVSFSTSESTAEQYPKAVVYGASRPRRDQRVTANHGTAVDLTDQTILEGQESVVDPADGTQFERGRDYQLAYQAGDFTPLADGRISDGQELSVSYDQRPRGTVAADSYAPATDQTLVRTVPSVSSNREAEQAALFLVDDLEVPLTTARLVLPRVGNRSLVDDLQVDGLPVDQRLEVRSVEQTPEQAVLELGSRDSVGDIVSRLERRLDATSEKV